MTRSMASATVSLEEVSHLALNLGRILFESNADTEEVERSVRRFAEAFGCEAHLVITWESLLVTLSCQDEFRTKTGNRIPAIGVNMASVADAKTLLAEVEAGLRDLGEIRRRLNEIEKQPPIYKTWMVVAALSLTAASLSRLFGGDWSTFGVAFGAATVGTWLRLEMGRRGGNVFLSAFLGATVSGIIAGVASLMKCSDQPTLCFLAVGMIIVPGVPLVNCVQDMIKNHMTLGLSRLGFATLLTLSIAVGLFVATFLTGVAIPVPEDSTLLPLAEDAVFSALAALGYLFLFNVPWRLAWVGIICGAASHTTRTFCLQHGIDIVTGSLIGALAAGFLSAIFAGWFRAPISAFAFPGVVAMIPGSYAFRAVIGFLEIIKAGPDAPVALLSETLALSATSLLMVLAIAIGVAAPMMVHKSEKSF